MEIPFKYRPEKHRVRRLAFSGWLDENFRGHGLFTYYHEVAKNWCIAQWADGDHKQWIRDIMVVGPSPTSFDRAKADQLMYLMKGPAVNANQDIKSAERTQLRQLQDWAEEERDLMRGLRRRDKLVESPVTAALCGEDS